MLAAPQDSFRAEDFIDTDALIDDIRRAIEAGEVPVIDLTDAGRITIISADVLLEIARLGVDVVVILPSGFTFTIIASSISENVGAFDLNIEVIVKYSAAQLETFGGGIVDISANSIVFRPNFHGPFGFEITFNITAEQLADAGIDIDTVRLYHADAIGQITDLGPPTVNDDGSVNFTINHASFYVLSSEPPVTLEIGTGIIDTGVVDDASPGITTGGEEGGAFAPIHLDIAEETRNLAWLLITLSAVGFIAAAGLTIFALVRRHNARKA